MTVEQLRAGDQLAEDLYTATGLLVLTRSTTISTKSQVKLSQYLEEEQEADLAVFVIDAESLTISPNAGDTRQIVTNIFLWALKLGQYRLFGVHAPSYN